MSIVRSTFAVGRCYRCTLICDPNSIESGSVGMLLAQWEPRLPTRPLNKAELRDYREGRNAFFAKVAKVSEMNCLLVEV